MVEDSTAGWRGVARLSLGVLDLLNARVEVVTVGLLLLTLLAVALVLDVLVVDVHGLIHLGAQGIFVGGPAW